MGEGRHRAECTAGTPPHLPKLLQPWKNSSANQGTDIQTHESPGSISHSNHNSKHGTLLE